jgi:hypothetical protein
MSLKDERAADAAELLAEIGEPVVWNGQTYNAIITALDLSDVLQVGGSARITISRSRSLRQRLVMDAPS